ncbi:zinc ribbon domain-containing protein [Paenibacillus sp. CAA11]|uniref:zinc ribbon domain-containing protein n=1 Tax=Paenibacillus sp. CAA11 TaxID=1532905 RepID=UPI00131F270D|nr:zinc ribbon domain-containing protein [Paenibacillus sp. CAA11]
MIECPNCHHVNEGGRFCENCGAQLIGPEDEIRPAQTGRPSGRSEAADKLKPYLEKTQQVSKQYFNYFVTLLKKPYTYASRTGKEQFVNSIITLVLYALMIPLTVYLGLKGYSYDASFYGAVIKPAVAFVIFGLLIGVYCFIAVKLGKVQADFGQVFGRFGGFMIPFVALLFVGLVLSLLQLRIFSIFMFIGFLGSIFSVPALLISSFKKDSAQGLDTVYCSIFTYLATFLTLWIMGRFLFGFVIDIIQQSFFYSFF